MGYVGRHFSLSSERSSGVFCDENGLLVGGVPLFERLRCGGSPEQWSPRSVFDLNRDLSKRYGLPVNISSKMGTLTAIARALDRGDGGRVRDLHPVARRAVPPDLGLSLS